MRTIVVAIALAAGLITSGAHACTQGHFTNGNVGDYEYDPWTGEWWLVAAHYDAGATPESTDYVYYDPSGGGGGGGGGEHQNGSGSAELSEHDGDDATLQSVSCTELPEVVVTGDTPPAGGGFLRMIGAVGSGVIYAGLRPLWASRPVLMADHDCPDQPNEQDDLGGAAAVVAANGGFCPRALNIYYHIRYRDGRTREWVTTAMTDCVRPNWDKMYCY
jgi:hypothetical protein